MRPITVDSVQSPAGRPIRRPGRQRGRAVPIRDRRARHAASPAVGHAADRQRLGAGRKGLDLQPGGPGQAPAQRTQAGELDRPAPDARPDHGLRRRGLRRRRPDRGPAAGHRAAHQLRDGSRHRGRARRHQQARAVGEPQARQGHGHQQPQVRALAAVHGEELRQKDQEGADRVPAGGQLEAGRAGQAHG